MVWYGRILWEGAYQGKRANGERRRSVLPKAGDLYIHLIQLTSQGVKCVFALQQLRKIHGVFKKDLFVCLVTSSASTAVLGVVVDVTVVALVYHKTVQQHTYVWGRNLQK